MSLVGPRPETPFFVSKFQKSIPQYMLKHYVKPGMTGWAQVNDLRGGDTSIEERIKYDMYYIENWTFMFDIKILFMTLTKVFSQKMDFNLEEQYADLPLKQPAYLSLGSDILLS